MSHEQQRNPLVSKRREPLQKPNTIVRSPLSLLCAPTVNKIPLGPLSLFWQDARKARTARNRYCAAWACIDFMTSIPEPGSSQEVWSVDPSRDGRWTIESSTQRVRHCICLNTERHVLEINNEFFFCLTRFVSKNQKQCEWRRRNEPTVSTTKPRVLR